MASITSWIRPIYLYLVCLVAIIVFIIGSVTILNLLIRNYVFGLKASYYNNPRYSCEHWLTEATAPKSQLQRATIPVADVPTNENGNVELTDDQRQKLYDNCIAEQEEDQKMQEKYQFANDVSRSFSMIFVSSIIFAFHWRIIRKEKHSA